MLSIAQDDGNLLSFVGLLRRAPFLPSFCPKQEIFFMGFLWDWKP